jgi:type II secretory ATPase GspE/PulE/Tfp pilus assembly ATPase PilB-like protein
MDIIGRKDIVSISHFLNEIILKSLEYSSSDVHIDPRSSHVDIHMRCLGSMNLIYMVDIELHEELIGRIKIVSKLRTDIHERAQDGRFSFIYLNESVDIRVSILPTYFGENVVLRVLRPEYKKELMFGSLGMFEDQSCLVSEALKLNQGIILVVGPTGSGKTTTMYSMIQSLTRGKKNIITIEDPIEYIIPQVRQIQVSEHNGFTFSSALRSVVRQDPDVLVIGEMRDVETAKLAFQAALTGHLVIASVHAEDCSCIYSRLLDLGIHDHSLGAIKLLISQRLLAYKAQSDIKRMGIFEVVLMAPSVRDVVYSKSFPEHIRRKLNSLGTVLLKDSYEKRVKDGIIFLEDQHIPI